MASTKREFDVVREIHAVWDFVSDMANWASQMPGYVSHEASSADDSAWTLNVDLGPFQRSIVVDVHVSKWSAPNEVTFDVKGRYEPFTGGGVYRAEALDTGTRITLDFHAEPGGSMARIISPLVGPVLEHVANDFSKNLSVALGGRLEATDDSRSSLESKPSLGFFQRMINRIKVLFMSNRD